MYESDLVSTFFYHRRHSANIPVGLQYHFEWVLYLLRDRSIYKRFRNIKSHFWFSYNEPWTSITMKLIFNSWPLLQNRFHDSLFQVIRLQQILFVLRVYHTILWIIHQYQGNNTPEVSDFMNWMIFIFLNCSWTPLHATFL